jgi:hypothetical protein
MVYLFKAFPLKKDKINNNFYGFGSKVFRSPDINPKYPRFLILEGRFSVI